MLKNNTVFVMYSTELCAYIIPYVSSDVQTQRNLFKEMTRFISVTRQNTVAFR